MRGDSLMLGWLILEVRLERHGHLVGHQLLPINRLEEVMPFDLADATCAAAKPLCRITNQQRQRDSLGLCMHVRGQRVREVLVLGHVFRLPPVVAAQRILRRQHLNHQDAHVPPVGRFAVVSLVDLRRAVAVRASDRHAAALGRIHGFGGPLGAGGAHITTLDRAVVTDPARRPHVRQLAVAVERKQHIVGLEITVQDVELV
mmetsp:Transcript_38397/g.101212  ORF Transcript_38397/g.101212 Transcript_38397/m.101212 type:complete len:202 (+) Transcript_38397:573-1178(+)